jgi:hypothetical protein
MTQRRIAPFGWLVCLAGLLMFTTAALAQSAAEGSGMEERGGSGSTSGGSGSAGGGADSEGGGADGSGSRIAPRGRVSDLSYERILNYASRIEVQKDAAVIVTETIRVVALGRRIRRGIYRDLP